MAKKKDIQPLVVTDENIEQLIDEGKLKVSSPEPSDDKEIELRNRVIFFRDKGFDNNRIAALLGIQKTIVDGIE